MALLVIIRILPQPAKADENTIRIYRECTESTQTSLRFKSSPFTLRYKWADIPYNLRISDDHMALAITGLNSGCELRVESSNEAINFINDDQFIEVPWSESKIPSARDADRAIDQKREQCDKNARRYIKRRSAESVQFRRFVVPLVSEAERATGEFESNTICKSVTEYDMAAFAIASGGDRVFFAVVAGEVFFGDIP
jgi:hypothetical protein